MFKQAKVGFIALCLLIGTSLQGASGSHERIAAAEKQPFPDIANHWAKESILKAAESGLVEGYPDGTFKPDAVVSGDQFVSMMLRAFSDGGENFDQGWLDQLMYVQPGFIGPIRSAVIENKFKFQNAKSGYWAKPFIDMLYDMDVMMTFDPVFPKDYALYKKQITRDRASYLLGKWFTTLETNFDAAYSEYVRSNSGLVDMGSSINSAASGYRATALIAGLMRGWNNHFYPNRYVTRAEALTMVQRLRDSSLRDPYKPNLKGQLYVELEGQIYLYSDKYKYDSYKKIVELAKKHVTSGYVGVGNLGVIIFDSRESFDKHDFLTRLGDFSNLPAIEFGLTVADGNSSYLSMVYPRNKKYPHSTTLVDAAFELFAGDSKGTQLKSKVFAMEKYLTTKAVEFSFNNRDFKAYVAGELIRLERLY
ncbi:S-layer homology domain-containing protein [Paenibacillus sp. N4]|uniref:S-layer homology domain-containing protein n=1 Tax=Paenibacillus vietnamensis TaxID=2590547 RepID=UPI001CD0F863|nr:S-layer homology domain-containing protein [Paenibacillus vietnamensis]MCA0756099.1 S-layer homology domain-containing protein [Paenibacillus vietnamensis]